MNSKTFNELATPWKADVQDTKVATANQKQHSAGAVSSRTL